MEKYRVQMSESLEDFLSMKEIWGGLHERSIFPTIFNSWEWIYSCIDGFRYKKFCILTAWDNLSEGKLPLLIIPLFIFKKGGVTYANVIGTEMSDYNNFLMDKDIKSMDLFYNTIRKAIKSYNIAKVDISQIPDEIYKGTVLTSRPYVNGLFLQKSSDTSTYCTILPENDFLKVMSNKFIKEIQKKSNKLKEQNAKILIIDNVTDDILDKFYFYHRERWGDRSVFLKDTYRCFLNNVCRLCSLNNSLVFNVIYNCDNEPISISICFKDTERLYGYLTVYNSKYSVFSPGMILTYNEYLYCKDIGLKYFDFLRGAEDYKKKWSAEECKISCMNIHSSTPIGFMLFLYDSIIYAMKKAKRFLKKFINTINK